MTKWMNGVGLMLVLGLVLAAGPLPLKAAGVPAAPQATTLAPESNDFATRVLGDPWDMSQFSDISAYLNDSGQRANLQNIQVANGVFSANATSTGDPNFTLLFPGYQNAIKVDKDGALHPIDSARYHCLYLAMYVQTSGFNQAQVFWFGDDRLNGGSQWGASAGISLANNAWLLYKVDLATKGVATGTGWTGRSTWQGLRIDPTNQANVNFQVDWARLTDCAADNVTVNWSSGNVSSLRLRPAGTTRDILVKTGLSGNSTTLDVQGIQPGTYSVRLYNSSGQYVQDASNQLVINQAPIASFVRPSFTSGQDFAAHSGNPWDFADGADIQSTVGMQTSLHDSLLDMTTPSGTGDPQIVLHAAQTASGATYRYLSFRYYTEWTSPWPNVPDGMIARWIWGIQGASGPLNRCFLVSHDIPFNVGWHIYNIDLWNGYNGAPLETAGDCPGNPPSWSNTPPVLIFRFDPNENVTAALDPITNGGPFHQCLDWIRLTAMDHVARGIPYELQLHLNRPAGEVTSVQYYYTTNRASPTQSPAQHYAQRAISGPFHFYLPLVATHSGGPASGDTLPSADLKYLWDTSPVSPNTYYLCAVVTISPNTATYCSDAPIQVL